MRGALKNWALWLAFLCSPMFYFSQTRLESVMGRVDARLQTAEKENGFSGVVCISKGQRPLLSRGYGWADPIVGLKNNPEKRFMIASVSKSFVACAILQLEQRGMLSVYDPIGKYLPEYPEWAGKIVRAA